MDDVFNDSEDDSYTKPILKNGKYRNPWKGYSIPSFTDVFKFLVFEKDNSNIPNKEELDKILPVEKPDFEKLNNPPVSGIQALWIGHASILVQFDGISVLADPVFSERCSPSQWVGPKRYRPTPCTVEELPHLDAVVISHSHYDHLDYNSVRQLNAKYGDKLWWYVPMGTKLWMTEAGCNNVVELSWWEEAHHPGKENIMFACTPTQHWSNRSPFDSNKTLWGSWVIKGPNHSFYFTGDSAYCAGFRQIGRKYGPFTLAAIPVGAYEPQKTLKYHHVNPEEAVQIHEDVKAQSSVAIHWGTFKMAWEPYLECRQRVSDAVKNRGLTAGCFFFVNHGRVFTVGGDNMCNLD
ncbi:hypothetical protein FSP39_008636 [Pinctada imbricata]|uniref:N-acetylphosphatidylethanolamine-hydrolyzing phospholipase D n=1 Tax=Pinctada imbricata TaxID=66713 RepID=A0AA88YCE0_PINIB|nr:hypothetical protein FSP39_008636 [Pinctada imbricata]